MLVEELNRKIKTVVDNAWKDPLNTTMNSMMEYIVKHAAEILLEEINITKDCIVDLSERIANIEALIELTDNNSQEDTLKQKEELNASKNGGIQKPQRNTKARNESPRL